MDLRGIGVRTKQEALKWLERTSLAGRRNEGPRAVFKKIAPGSTQNGFEAHIKEDDLAGAAEVLLRWFKEVGTHRFFEGAASTETAILVNKTLPSEGGKTVAVAEAICLGRFNLLGYRGLFFGDPVDWHLDPISGRRAPFMHWSRINPLDPSMVGDSKIIWELNRHQWLVTVGQAYQLTGDERYAQRFATAIQEWIKANPPGMGINWASSLEVALRIISWCWALFLFRESKLLSAEFFLQMLEQIRIHATHVERYLSYYFSPNTHLTGEALGLFYAGVVFPELQRASHWRRLGAWILTDQILRQVLPDGVYFEQSTCYQRYTVEIYLHFLLLGERNGEEIPTAVHERVQDMLDFLLAVRRPDGSVPQIGDTDGGWLLPLIPRAPDDFRGVFSTTAALFGRSDYAWAAGELAPETLWLLGPAGLKAFEAIQHAPPTMKPSCLFPEGGYAVMRSGWEQDAHHLIFDVGPLGCPVSGGHGHADLLTIQCSVFGEPYLVDPGTYCYTMDRDWRDFFRGTAAHSTVTIDGEGQAVPAGPFCWKGRPRARLRQWLSTETYDFADAEHEAYGDLPDPVVHRRRVLFVKPHYWVVVDNLTGRAEHRVQLRFQFAPMKVTVDSDLWARAHGPRGHGLLIRAFATVPLKADVLEGKLAPIQGWISPAYGQHQPAPVLTYTTVTCLPLRIVTLLIPMEDLFASPPAVSLFIGKEPDPVCLFFQDMQETIVMNEQDIILEHR